MWKLNRPILQWAIERAGRATALYERFPSSVCGNVVMLSLRLSNSSLLRKPPICRWGTFLPEPPEEPLPIPDMRTIGGHGVQRPSPDLLDMIYLCQRRQSWYQDYADSMARNPVRLSGLQG